MRSCVSDLDPQFWFATWYLYKMVAQNILPTYDVK